MMFAKALCIALLLYSTSYGESRTMDNNSSSEKRTGMANTPSTVAQSHRQKVLDATRVSPAQPQQNIKIGQKRHLKLPDNFIKNIARHVKGKQKRSMKMHDKKSIDYDAEKEIKNIHQRRHMKKEEVPQVTYSLSRGHTTTGFKRNPLAVGAAVGSDKIQEAVVEKGIEVVGNAIDKQIANIEGAQNKSEAFLNSRIRLDISPEKGWSNEDMFVPPGYHLNAEIDSENKKAENNEQGGPVYAYPAGIGTTMMNGCWGTGYKPGDPCYQSLEVLTACQNMIDGAAFIGVGFDGRGKYSPESRKMSIIQRSCGGRQYYDDFQVPDTMNVHGIYETSSTMQTFSSRREYQSYLQTEAGASGSFFGFYAGVKSAYGMSSSSNQQTNLAVFDFDILRYEIFKDEVKPQDLSRAFLHEFVSLPESYFQPGAAIKFSDFISRWGTHYIKSAKFGGQLEIRKLQNGISTSSKQEFAVEAEMEYKGLFASGGAYSSTKGGSQEKSEQKFMSTSVQALGGSQRIAAAVTDLYAPTFKNTLVEWLDSIDSYPKAFKFLMGSITDLVDFRAADLFPDDAINWGCEKNSQNLVKEESTGKYFYNRTVTGGVNKTYCDFASRDELEIKLKQRRTSLKAAIEAYMEEGPVSATDMNLQAGDGGCETQDLEGSLAIPRWNDIFNQEEVFHVIFDMDVDLRGSRNNIQKSMSRLAKRNHYWWVTANENGKFHWFRAFSNGGSRTSSNNKISILGLVLTYAESDGSLTLASADYDESSKYFTNIDEHLKDKVLARIEWPAATLFSRMTSTTTRLHTPCNVKWSNPLRFDPNDANHDKCVHFSAFAQGTVYIIFSSIPTKKETWYSIEISTDGVVVYKGNKILDYSLNQNAVSIGSSNLYQSYYACLTEAPESTVIEYGKTQANTNFGDNYLTIIDRTNPIHARFYTFGNGEHDVTIMDVQVMPRSGLTQECKGGTVLDAAGHFCVRKPCHQACDEVGGCRPPAGNTPLPSECYSCKYAKNGQDCVLECPSGMVPNKNKKCSRNFDLTFKGSIGLKSTSATIPSTLSAFTICLWINLPTYTQNYFGKEYTVLGYVPSGSVFSTFMAHFHLAVRYEKQGEASLLLKFYYGHLFFLSSHSVKLNVGANTNKWNFFCATRESSSGKTKLFWHGKTSISANRFLYPGHTMKKGGKFIVAGAAKRNINEILKFPVSAKNNLPLTITQTNVWDRSLTQDEISGMSRQKNCGGGAGNVLDWEDLGNQLNLNIFTKNDQSQCASASGSMF